jgi:hypothetical protein
MNVRKRKRVWVFVALLAGAQLPSLWTGARTVSVCGAGACLTTALEADARLAGGVVEGAK